MKYIFLTFSGYSFPIAKQLLDEGNDVIIGQIKDPADLQIDGWQGEEEAPERKKRRLEVYAGILKKLDGNALLKKMQFIADKPKGVEDYFVVLDHNNLCRYGDKILAMGFTGFIPNSSDYEREKDRKAAHIFVKKHYPKISVPKNFPLKKVQDGIDLVSDSDNLWVLKSNGNLGETIVPKVQDVSLNHQEIMGALEHDKANYEKGGYILEEKIARPVEFTPEIAFWDGEPIYSQVEIECKPIGAGDIGSDGGGSINLVIRTALDDELNKLCFPPIVFEMAKKRRGLFIFDAGILYDPKTKEYYFTEFAGNRWSWGGVFSELSMATKGGRVASNYFEAVAAGKNPLNYEFGTVVSFFNILQDAEHPKLHATEIPVYWDEDAGKHLYLFQIRKDGDKVVNVGVDDILFGFAGGYGRTLEDAVRRVYKVVESVSFREILYRHKSDYLSEEYPSSILNRVKFLVDNKLISEDVL